MYLWRCDLLCIWWTALGHKPALRESAAFSHMSRGGGKECCACLQDTAGPAVWWAPRCDSVILSSLSQLGLVTPQISQFISSLVLPSNFHCNTMIFTKTTPYFILLQSHLRTAWFFLRYEITFASGNLHNCMDCRSVFKLLILDKPYIFIAFSAPGTILVHNKGIPYAESLGQYRKGD